MVPDYPFDSARTLIARAREHIGCLDASFKAFLETKPYARAIDLDPDTGEQVHKVRLVAKLPRRAEAILKDAASNLRDALDHAVHCSALILDSSFPNCTGFPFATHPNGVAGELESDRLKGIHPEIRALLAGFEPYETGNKLLWGLNRIRVPTTHRMLIPMLIAPDGVFIGPGTFRMVTDGTSPKIGYSKWNPAENEVEYMRLPGNATAEYEVNLTVRVVLDNIPALADQEVVSALYAIASEVDRIVSAIEAETHRVFTARP